MSSYKDRPREISLLLQTDLLKILTSNPIAQLNQLKAAQIGPQGEKSDVSDIIHKELPGRRLNSNFVCPRHYYMIKVEKFQIW